MIPPLATPAQSSAVKVVPGFEGSEPLTPKRAKQAGEALSTLKWPRPKPDRPPRKDDWLQPLRDIPEEEAVDLVRRGALVNERDENNEQWALVAAVKRPTPFVNLIRVLVEARADLEHRDCHGKPVLFHALHNPPALKELLAARCDISAELPKNCRTPLHVAAEQFNIGAMECLCKHRAEVNAQDSLGFTPLHWAAGRGDVRAVKLLLDCRADPAVEANKGKTPVVFAETNPHHSKAILEEFARRGVKPAEALPAEQQPQPTVQEALQEEVAPHAAEAEALPTEQEAQPTGQEESSSFNHLD
mmetsp:Transcript_12630/g.35974  ORF Transcript_12630/g.35974 Transcript_12630/m.35974 type:complete len:302 (+) Transcript_12630:55-960(+)